MTLHDYLTQRIADLGGYDIDAPTRIALRDDGCYDDEIDRSHAETIDGLIEAHIAHRPREYDQYGYMSALEAHHMPDRLLEWHANPGMRNLGLLGPVGVGKTTAAHALMSEEFARNVANPTSGQVNWHWYSDCIPNREWYSVPQLLDSMHPTQVPREITSEVYSVAANVPFVVLDDLLAASNSDWKIERIGMLVEDRWRKGLRTVYTSSAPLVELAKYWNDLIVSRLGHGATVTVKGASHRTTVPW
jgi:hypothetical protein